MWCIPPKANAAFVAQMEDVLAVYTRPDNPRRPLVCMDELSKQLLGEMRQPLPMRAAHPARPDDEYVRGGTANLFMLCEPLRGWRQVTVTQRRTRRDWAQCIRELVDDHYPDAERVVRVLDTLNTHTLASRYETFPPAEARRIAARLEVHDTPKHGSGLNRAEIELAVLGMQCLGQRREDRTMRAQEVAAGNSARNAAATGVDWHFTTADARIKLKHLYPSIEP